MHHPAFQSVLLPLLMSLLGVAAWCAARGPRQAAWGAWLGVLVAWAWLPGFEWPALARTQKLPWVALLAVVALGLARPGAWLAAPQAGAGRTPVNLATAARLHGVPFLFASALWAGSAFWLAAGHARLLALVAAVLAGGLALGLVQHWGTAPKRSAPGTMAACALASLGLAVLCATGGSLLLAQLALALASSAAALAVLCAALPRWRPGLALPLPAQLLQAYTLLALAIAWSWLLAQGWADGAGLPTLPGPNADPADPDDPYLTR